MPRVFTSPPLPARKIMPAMEQTMAPSCSLVKPCLKTVPMTIQTTEGYRKLSMMAMPTGRYR